ncbi:hypothetical protein F4604DRAFT_1689498 [Suillus subluteus]|nr:hypothetical protein F4604DRAFT_1689498 [Suillus subluteus]
MSDISPEFLSYVNHMTFLRNGMSHLPVIPEDWALHTTNLASEWVEQQFLAHISGRPLVQPPPELDTMTLLSCGQLTSCMADAYRNPVKLDINVIQWNGVTQDRQTDRTAVMVVMGALHGCNVLPKDLRTTPKPLRPLPLLPL